MDQRSIVLVTPARNEAAYIGRTIEGVLEQTILPRRWVIVSDGSVDQTDEIVERYAQKHSFIKLLRAERSAGHKRKDFGSKVNAFRAGYDLVRNEPHEFVGNLDADIALEAHYFEQILHRFDANSRLGLAGGIVLEPIGDRLVRQNTSLNSVCGSVHLFRRSIYDQFGGYIPISVGGVDAAAEIMVRMHGWDVETFPDVEVRAQRRVSTGGATIYHTRFRQGVSYNILGYHPLFLLGSCITRVSDKPYVAGSVCTVLGYTWSRLKRDRPALPAPAVRYLRAEQMARLTAFFRLKRDCAGPAFHD